MGSGVFFPSYPTKVKNFLKFSLHWACVFLQELVNIGAPVMGKDYTMSQNTLIHTVLGILLSLCQLVSLSIHFSTIFVCLNSSIRLNISERFISGQHLVWYFFSQYPGNPLQYDQCCINIRVCHFKNISPSPAAKPLPHSSTTWQFITCDWTKWTPTAGQRSEGMRSSTSCFWSFFSLCSSRT